MQSKFYNSHVYVQGRLLLMPGIDYHLCIIVFVTIGSDDKKHIVYFCHHFYCFMFSATCIQKCAESLYHSSKLWNYCFDKTPFFHLHKRKQTIIEGSFLLCNLLVSTESLLNYQSLSASLIRFFRLMIFYNFVFRGFSWNISNVGRKYLSEKAGGLAKITFFVSKSDYVKTSRWKKFQTLVLYICCIGVIILIIGEKI